MNKITSIAIAYIAARRRKLEARALRNNYRQRCECFEQESNGYPGVPQCRFDNAPQNEWCDMCTQAERHNDAYEAEARDTYNLLKRLERAVKTP